MPRCRIHPPLTAHGNVKRRCAYHLSPYSVISFSLQYMVINCKVCYYNIYIL
nr:MAG TPA: hypothetical protein [Caudoviricetes sp.]